MPPILLPTRTGTLERFTPTGTPVPVTPRPAPTSRVAIAAAHVVADPLADVAPGTHAAVDWDATLAVRRHLLDQGLGIAEIMDTAQRGMGLDWPTALELARRTATTFGPHPPAPIVHGCGTDHLAPGSATTLDDVTTAYLHQATRLQAAGARHLVLMASRELARVAAGPACYHQVYRDVIAACDEPVVLHWLGEMFDPALRGYWGGPDLAAARASCLALIDEHAARIDGIKVSLLDQRFEEDLRRDLPAGVRLYTGDDFNYPALIAGDGTHHSDALLGILDPIAPAAAAAFAALDAGDTERFTALLAPTVPLARAIFAAPTQHYKVGVVFLAWLNGLQDHFTMVGGVQGMRSLPHLAELLRLADGCGLLADPGRAGARMRHLLAVHGVGD